jgi:hypothetical protein
VRKPVNDVVHWGIPAFSAADSPAEGRKLACASPMPPWPPSRERLLEMLAETEGHIATVVTCVERQRRIIADLETAGHGSSRTAETLRTLLATMQKSERLYARDRERIQRLLNEAPE